jgi:DNA-binding transcriptional regulator YiaG
MQPPASAQKTITFPPEAIDHWSKLFQDDDDNRLRNLLRRCGVTADLDNQNEFWTQLQAVGIQDLRLSKTELWWGFELRELEAMLERRAFEIERTTRPASPVNRQTRVAAKPIDVIAKSGTLAFKADAPGAIALLNAGAASVPESQKRKLPKFLELNIGVREARRIAGAPRGTRFEKTGIVQNRTNAAALTSARPAPGNPAKNGRPAKLTINGDVVRKLRADLGLSQEAFCRGRRLSTDTLQDAERGLASESTQRKICRIAVKNGVRLTLEDLKKTGR